MAGAKLTILDGSNAGQTAITSSQGVYSFPSLMYGDANLSATANGYREARAGVHLSGTNTLDFTLQPD